LQAVSVSLEVVSAETDAMRVYALLRFEDMIAITKSICSVPYCQAQNWFWQQRRPGYRILVPAAGASGGSSKEFFVVTQIVTRLVLSFELEASPLDIESGIAMPLRIRATCHRALIYRSPSLQDTAMSCGTAAPRLLLCMGLPAGDKEFVDCALALSVYRAKEGLQLWRTQLRVSASR
jgi:hypothetical protein